ncbi:MAG: GDSL-type esterase/lipase family protein [Steroidobacteraceae bacterium]
MSRASHRFASALVAASLLLGLASASADEATGPTPYPKDQSAWPGDGAIRVFDFMNDNRRSFWKKREQSQGSVVFVGDSLIGGWKTLAQDFPGMRSANRGIGGEPTRGLLFRFQEDVLDLHPRGIVILSGGNDLSARQDADKSRTNLLAILAEIDRQTPGVPVIVCTVPPRADPKAPVDAGQLRKLNRIIMELGKGHPNVTVVDLYALLADPDGSPHADYFVADRVHLTPAGYERLRGALQPVLVKLKLL